MSGATKRVTVWRCPKCGSTDAGPDESRSAYDLTFMHCASCGEEGFFDSWERDSDWLLELELPADATAIPPRVAPLASGSQATAPAAFGCALCTDKNASEAWHATQKKRDRSLVQESHFGVHLSSCTCGQRFVTVFTERIDWSDGEDEQDWLVVPVSTEEATRLSTLPEEQLTSAITELGRARRFLVRSFPTGGSLSAWWREGGLMIGRHD